MLKLSANIFKMSSAVRWAFNWKEWDPCWQEFEHAISCVQSEEKARLGRFVFRKDVRASLAGRLLMRKFINEYAGLPYDQVTFVRDERNKPLLKDSAVNVSLNVSHQGSYTVLAGEVRDVKIGVDVMTLGYRGGRSVSEFFRLMNRNFSAAEWQEIKGSAPGKPEREQVSMFYRHWALKESYVKALGVGIVVDLSNIDFRTKSKLSENRITTDTVLYVDGIEQNWLFEESLLDSQHCVVVALQKDEKSPSCDDNTFEMMDYDKLMAHSVPLFPTDSQYATEYFAKSEEP